jgi:hypothetical protein
LVESAAVKDKVEPKPSVKDGVEPLQVSNAQMADHQNATRSAAGNRPDATGAGMTDGHTIDVGHTARLYDQSAAKSPEKLADNTAGKTDKPETAALDRTAKANDGADAARDIQVQPGDKPPTRSDKITYDPNDVHAKDVQASREKLIGSENGMSPELKASMTKHMDDLEHRLPPATAEQIAGVYDATSKLLNDPEKTSPLNQNERNRLANDILSNAAQQHEIDQGMHNTCNVTTLEQTLNRESPDKAARLVAEVGLTGQYKSPADGQIIKLDPRSIHPDNETNFGGTQAKDGDRNYASQAFDMATINDYWQHQNPKGMYTQTAARDGQSDTGERLMYANGQEMRGPDGRPMRQPGLGTEAMAQIGKDIGLKGDYIVSTKQFEHDGGTGVEGDKRVQSYDEFKEALAKNPTSIVFLNGKDKLFTGTDDKGGSSGGHVVTVSDFRKGPPDEVYMRNQWGSENNKWVSVADLYNASLPPGSRDRVEPAAVQNNPGPVQDGGVRPVQQGEHGGEGVSVNPGGDNVRVHGSDSGSGGTPWNRDDHTMNDDEFKKWKEQIKKEDPADPANRKAHKLDVDVQALIGPLQARLEEAKALKDDFNASMLDAQINNLRNSQ